KLGLQVPILFASTDRDLDNVFATLPQLQAGGLVIAGEPFLASRSERLAALALQHKVLAISQQRAFVAAGGLMSSGNNDAEASRLVGLYTGRVLKGETRFWRVRRLRRSTRSTSITRTARRTSSATRVRTHKSGQLTAVR